jgi:AP-3 complex subunit delta-1
MTKLLPTHPHLLTSHSSTILGCIDDPDPSIRTRALDLLEGMVDRSNLQAIVKRLLSQLQPTAPSAHQALAHIASGASTAPTLADPAYKASLIRRILRTTTHASYARIANFHWFIDLLVQLARLAISLPSSEADLTASLSSALIDVCARVRALRPYALSMCLSTLLPERLLPTASAWLVGEYAGSGAEVFDWAKAIGGLREAGCLYAAVKVLARWCAALEEGDGWMDGARMRELEGAARGIRDDAQMIEVRLHLAMRSKMTRDLVSGVQRPAGHHAGQLGSAAVSITSRRATAASVLVRRKQPFRRG